MAQTGSTAPQPVSESGVYLFFRVTRESIRMYSAARVGRAPRAPLRSPMLTAETIERLDRERRTKLSELVLSICDAERRELDTFAWPAEADVFIDRIDPKTDEFRGGPVRVGEWEARVRVPLREHARYLLFYRTDVFSPPTYTPLGLFDLQPGEPGGLLPMPVPLPDPPTPIPLPLPPLGTPRGLLRELALLHRIRSTRWWVGGGYIKDARTLINTGDPADRFDIVILGDGFQESELAAFDYHAELVTQSLTETEPFATYTDRINVHVVRTVSLDSGISRCPAGDQNVYRNTYFSTSGFFNDAQSPSYIGTPVPLKVMDAVDAVIPQAYANLVIVIVNCHVHGGGSAPPNMGIAFVTLSDDDETFRHVVAHESAHVVAHVAEEYNSCTGRDPNRVYLNEATKAEVDSDTVWWKTLALPAELDGANHFRVIHNHGDGETSHPYNGGIASCQPDLSAGVYELLGAFWGGQNGDPPATEANPNTGYCDPRGASFYRPMAECKMRRRKYPFCRVCRKLISDAILMVAP